jgi:hypothetical protein
LKRIGAGGAPVAPKMVGDIAAAFKSAQPTQGFGMTETNAITTLNTSAMVCGGARLL